MIFITSNYIGLYMDMYTHIILYKIAEDQEKKNPQRKWQLSKHKGRNLSVAVDISHAYIYIHISEYISILCSSYWTDKLKIVKKDGFPSSSYARPQST